MLHEKARRIAFYGCAVGFVVCCLLLGITLFLTVKDKNLQVSLLYTMQESEADEAAQDQGAQETLAKFAELYAENADFIGWVSIDDTEINYPVMHTPSDAEYYLHKDFNGDYSFAGTIFVGGSCSITPRSDNVILYGHNMANGSMFASLLNYQSQSYWQAHSVIQFDTLTEEQTYQIAYAFVEDIGVDHTHFAFYNFIEAEDEAAFDDFIATCAEYSLYDTGITPEYGDALLTLVTCKGYDTTERMVVVAVAVE